MPQASPHLWPLYRDRPGRSVSGGKRLCGSGLAHSAAPHPLLLCDLSIPNQPVSSPSCPSAQHPTLLSSARSPVTSQLTQDPSPHHSFQESGTQHHGWGRACGFVSGSRGDSKRLPKRRGKKLTRPLTGTCFLTTCIPHLASSPTTTPGPLYLQLPPRGLQLSPGLSDLSLGLLAGQDSPPGPLGASDSAALAGWALVCSGLCCLCHPLWGAFPPPSPSHFSSFLPHAKV